MNNIDEIVDLLSGDPIRRYRDTIESIIADNRKKIIKCCNRLKYNTSIKEQNALIRMRRKTTDKIIEYIKFLEPEYAEQFWDLLMKDIHSV